MPDNTPRTRRLTQTAIARLVAAAVLLGVLAPAVPSALAERTPAATPAASTEANPAATPRAESGQFELVQSTQSVAVDGTLGLAVRSRLATETPYLEVRFQVMRPAGGVMLQKTEIRHDLPAGPTEIRFGRELSSLGLRPAAYPVNIRIRHTGEGRRTEERTLEGTLFLYDPKAPPTPVAVVVRLTGVPRLDTEGRFAEDPAAFTAERDLALGLARDLTSSGGRFSFAVPPMMLDEWRRASGGYAVAGPEGVREVEAGSAASAAYASAVSSVASLTAMERVELLDVPYADPDLVGLGAAGAAADLQRHYDVGLSAYLASLDQTPTVGTALFEDRLTPDALPSLTARGIAYAVVSPASLAGKDAASESGAYRVRESTATVLVADENLAKDLMGDSGAAFERLFERHLDGTAQPSVVTLTLGRGRDVSPAEVADVLSAIQAAPWIRTVTAGEAASLASADDRVALAEGKLEASVPADYWREVAEGRTWASALSAAAGERDRDAEAAWYAAMLAESGTWAGADGSWSLADRGRAFAAAAKRVGTQVLGGVDLETQDVTLAGQDGEVPVSLANRAERPLSVTVRVESDTLAFPGGNERNVQLLPVENYLTFPVDLESGLSGKLRVSVSAGGVMLQQSEVDVRASYIDRIALVSAVVLVLVGMLFYIKRRVDRADADIIENGRR